jgi:hypothetical protein
MKNTEKLGGLVGVLLVGLVVGFLSATLVTFTVGLLFTFPFTLLNILKVWLAVTVLDLLVGKLMRKR